MKVKNSEIQTMVIEKTREMIINLGLKGWNMVDLAKKTGLAKQTLYRIIGSKELVITEVVLSQMEYTFGNFNKILKTDRSFDEKLQLLYERVPEFISDVPRVTLAEIYREYPAIEKRANDFQDKIAIYLIDFIKEGMEMNYFRDDLDPEFLFDLMRGGVLEHYIRSGQTGSELKSSLKKAYAYILDGVRVKKDG